MGDTEKEQELREPPLHGVHDSLGAKFTDFGGWDMPVEFDSIREEHTSVRESAGIFDVSHMGRVRVRGQDAEQLMQRLTTNDVSGLDGGDSQYSMITNEEGIILDDTVVYRFSENNFVFVPNAGHDSWAEERWEKYRDKWNLDATIENETEETAMFAVQGPDAPEHVKEVVGSSLDDVSKFEFAELEVSGDQALVARTGYTGEDGFELILDASTAEDVWNAFLKRDVQPCGLGARDTLRIEMGFLLSGQDFDPENNPRNPYEAGVSFTVKLEKDFLGRDSLERAKDEIEEKFVGFKLTERGVPRNGYTIEKDGDEIGGVTSGTMSPTLNEPIGLGYVPVEYAEPGTEVGVLIRGKSKKAKITETPFLSK